LQFDSLTEMQKKIMDEEVNARKKFDEYLANLAD
jgi:hypothetical protein